MKTIREHLQELPEPARSRALVNMWWEDAENTYREQKKALYNAFNWSTSPEGYKYWNQVYQQLDTH